MGTTLVHSFQHIARAQRLRSSFKNCFNTMCFPHGHSLGVWVTRTFWELKSLGQSGRCGVERNLRKASFGQSLKLADSQ